MAVGTGGRPEVVTFASKPRAIGFYEPSCTKFGRSTSKPAAGSAAAVVAERRRPSVDKVPMSVRAHRSPNPQPCRAPLSARLSVRSAQEHTTPQCHPPRPPSPSTRKHAHAIPGAPRQPVPPPRSSSRGSSPRARPLSARREADVDERKSEAEKMREENGRRIREEADRAVKAQQEADHIRKAKEAACIQEERLKREALEEADREADLNLIIAAEMHAVDGKVPLVQHVPEHLNSRSQAMPLRNDRPVATPFSPSKALAGRSVGDVLKSSVEIVNDAVCATTASGNLRVAELWLRLSRIALLEFPHRERRVNGKPLSQGSCRNQDSVAPTRPCNDSNEARALEEERREARALQAWSRILSRVAMVTGTRLEVTPVDAELSGACIPDITDLPRQRPPHICLGDMLEESVSWLDVDSEEDQNSPKKSDLLAAMEEEQAMAEEQPVPRGFEAIARQQRAPGIVEGMCKCLSF